jgi:hypothetical protein
MEKTVKDIGTVKIPTPAIEHNGTVRMGMMTPPFPPVHAKPTGVVHKGNIRVGSFSPLFPATPAK